MDMKILAIGDIVGKPGREAVTRLLPDFCRERGVDFCLANAENAAGGSGLTPAVAAELTEAGVDVLTTGDHVYRQKEIIPELERSPAIVRPANLPPGAAGRGWTVRPDRRDRPVAVVNLLGQTYMDPADSPFALIDRLLPELKAQTPVIVIDFHAEATSEKIALGWHLAGEASLIAGTHTHVPTADARVLPGGTAYITDLGMTGPYASVLGRRVDRVLIYLRTRMPAAFTVAKEDIRLCGVLATVDGKTGRARAVERIELPLAGR